MTRFKFIKKPFFINETILAGMLANADNSQHHERHKIKNPAFMQQPTSDMKVDVLAMIWILRASATRIAGLNLFIFLRVASQMGASLPKTFRVFRGQMLC